MCNLNLELFNKKSLSTFNLDSVLDLDNPAVFLFKVGTDAFVDNEIHKEDILVIKRDVLIESKDLVVVSINDSFYLREYVQAKRPFLKVANNKYPIIFLDDKSYDITLIGKVTYLIRKPLLVILKQRANN